MKQVRRKLITALPLGVAFVPCKWTKPVVDSVFLPAHAQTTSTDEQTQCNPSTNFIWSNSPSTSGTTASGDINGLGYTYTSNEAVLTSPDVYSHTVFPASFAVPNTTSIRNQEITSNTLSFSSSLENPVLLIASIGKPTTPVSVTFSDPIRVLFSQGVTIDSSTQITGREGYVILQFNGIFSSVSFDYLQAEVYANFTFGADFSTPC